MYENEWKWSIADKDILFYSIFKTSLDVLESHSLYILKEILQLVNGATPVKHECDTRCTFLSISKKELTWLVYILKQIL